VFHPPRRATGTGSSCHPEGRPEGVPAHLRLHWSVSLPPRRVFETCLSSPGGSSRRVFTIPEDDVDVSLPPREVIATGFLPPREVTGGVLLPLRRTTGTCSSCSVGSPERKDEPATLLEFSSPSTHEPGRVHSTPVCHTGYVPSPGFLTLSTACSSPGRPAFFRAGNAHGVTRSPGGFPHCQVPGFVTSGIPS